MLDHNSAAETRDYIVGYLRVLFDGKGSFDGHEVVLSSTDRRLLSRCQRYLGLLDIDSKLHGPYGHQEGAISPIYRLRIFRKSSMVRFFEIIGFRAAAKRARALRWLSGRRTRYGVKKEPDDIDELIWRLREDGVTYAEIGRRLGGISPQAVHQRYKRTREYFEEMARARIASEVDE